MFNWGKTSHDESAEAVGGALSQEESDVALRLRLFKQCPSYAHPRGGFGVFFPSPFAVRTLWNYQIELKYVAEAERRRKRDLPAETFKEFLEKERPGNEYPVLLGTVILTIAGIFMVDIDRSRGHLYYQVLTQMLKHPSCVHLLLSIFGLIASGFYLEGRHGSAKVAGVSLCATSAAVALGFALDPNRRVYMSITLAHALLGMNWADMWVSWGMFSEIGPLLSGKLNYESDTFPAYALAQAFHMTMLLFLEGWPFTLEILGRPEWLGNASANLFSLCFGFFFALPFLSNMTDSVVFGNQPEWTEYFRQRRLCMWGLMVPFASATLFVTIVDITEKVAKH